MEQSNGWPTILEENWKMQQDTHSSIEQASSKSPIEHLAHVASYSTRSLLEALLAANTKRSRITSITAKSCGVAFLAGSPNILPMLKSPMRYIKVLDFQADLVTQDAFELKDGELVLLSRERCREALHKSISYGLLGKFLSTAQDLEVLIIDLRCHEMMSPVVEASDLVDVLGLYTWYNLQHLSIGGIWASQSQLLDFLGRHRDTLRSLSIHDVVLKEGCWQTCFGEMRRLLADTQLCSQSIHLGGVLYKQDSDDQGLCWDLSGTDRRGER